MRCGNHDPHCCVTLHHTVGYVWCCAISVSISTEQNVFVEGLAIKLSQLLISNKTILLAVVIVVCYCYYCSSLFVIVLLDDGTVYSTS